MTPQIILFLLFALFGLVLAGVFFRKKKGDVVANRILGIYTLLFSYEIIYNCLNWSGLLYYGRFIHLFDTQFPLWLVYGALVYLYIKRVVKKTAFKPVDAWVFIPAIIVFVLFTPFYLLGTEKKTDAVYNYRVFDYAWFSSSGIWWIIGGMVVFGVCSYFTYHRKKEIGYKERLWLNYFLGSYAGFVFLFALYFFLVRFEVMPYEYDYFIDAGLVFFIGMLVYFGLVQPDVFEGIKPLHKVLPFVKYKKSGISPALANDLKQKLAQIMTEKKPYLNTTLRLNDLAELLAVSRNHTSQIINEQFNLSFFDFVNKYRVEEAISILQKGNTENLNMDQIAYSVGFNSRATFYKAFKKFTQTTPTQFLTKNNKEQ